MGLTKFPQGVSSYGMPVIGAGPLMTFGKIFFVHAGTGATGNTGLDPDRPLTTIDAAINKCTATSSTYHGEDVVVVMPGHAETIGGASGIDYDVAGITVIGLGRDGLRPTLTFDTTTDTTAVGANGIRISNLLHLVAVDAQVTMLDVDATTGLEVLGCEFKNVETDENWLDPVDIADEVQVRIKDCYFNAALGQTGGQSCILGTTPDRLVIQGCYFDADAATGIIEMGAGTNIHIESNYIRNRSSNDEAIVIAATATGWINDNWIRLADNATNVTEAISDGAGGLTLDVQMGRNWVVNADGERVLEHNQTATTDAG